jgi:hypothetical protein
MIEKEVIDIFSTLLSEGNVVKQSDLVEAKGIAKELAIPLNKALTMSGVASEGNINLALEAQSLVEQKEISLDLAVRAVRLAVQDNTDLEAAIAALALIHKATQPTVQLTNDLTALLLAAKLINGDQLGQAIKRSGEAKMLMGHTLVLMECISPSNLAAALHAVLLLRQKLLDDDKAAQGLRYANQRDITIEQALFELGFFTPAAPETMRLSELAYMAGLLSESDLVECLELELFKQKQFGQVLMEQGLISATHLDDAITLQGAVANSILKPYQAATALGRVCKDNINVYQAMAEAQADGLTGHELRLGELMVAATVCSQDELDEVIDGTKNTAIKIGKALLNSGRVKEAMLYNALRCQSLFRQGYFSAQQAIASLKHCQSETVNFDQAMIELNYNVPSRMQWLWV